MMDSLDGDALDLPASDSAPCSDLPDLHSRPRVYASCCLALSRPLLDSLYDLLPKSPNQILSVGSGSGLLEALLMSDRYGLDVIGVEVQPSPNRYLPALHHRTVNGSRFLDPTAKRSDTWLFVYPRRIGLVSEYLATYGHPALRKVIWIGPAADWPDYAASFARDWFIDSKTAAELGGQPWDLVIVMSRRTHPC